MTGNGVSCPLMTLNGLTSSRATLASRASDAVLPQPNMRDEALNQ
jgi:hypothetical protein